MLTNVLALMYNGQGIKNIIFLMESVAFEINNNALIVVIYTIFFSISWFLDKHS
jgi:TM2 domain-containing membrane protein YozV